MDEHTDILNQQIAYYVARADEYDEWFFRKGRYDRGEDHRKVWCAELAHVEAALKEAQPGGRILELACGTGLWTRHLLPRAEELTVVDASPEMLALCRERIAAPGVKFVQADLFEWWPSETYDFIFFGFWLSHVPEDKFDAFWARLATALNPEGKVFFVDSLFTQSSTATDHERIDRDGIVERKLNDGRRFKVVKVFHEADVLKERLMGMGWDGFVQSTDRFFLYGQMSRPPISADS